MAIVNDKFAIDIITELDGVQMTNVLYFEIDDIGDDPSIQSMIADILNAYHFSISLRTNVLWKVVCGKFENITTPEAKVIQFLTLPGLDTLDCHPQHQVLRFNKHGQQQPENIIHRGAFNQSGVSESYSLRGLLNNTADFSALEQFLHLPGNFGGTGWTCSALIRWNDPQPPLFETDYKYDVVRKVQVHSQFKTLRSRKTVLCAVS